MEFVKNLGLPLLVLGGGGYTIKNVARCWAYETSIIVEQPVSNSIPQNDYIEWYAPSYNLHLIPDPTKENENTKEYLEARTYFFYLISPRIRIIENLRDLEHAPSVQFQNVPQDYAEDVEDTESEDDYRSEESKYRIYKSRRWNLRKKRS